MINIRNNCRKKLIIKKSNKEKFYFYFFVNCNLLKKNFLILNNLNLKILFIILIFIQNDNMFFE